MEYFSSLRLDELKTVIDYLEDVNFAKGACIVREGDPGDSCYIIESGRVRLEVADSHTDTDLILGYIDPGMALGEFSLIDREPRSASAFADIDVHARKLTTASFDRLCVENPRLGNSLLKFLSNQLVQKMRQANKQLRNFMITDTVPEWVDEMVRSSIDAQNVLATWKEDKLDALLSDIADVICQNAEKLAKATVKESGFGVVEHKIKKIEIAAGSTFELIKGKNGIGLLNENKAKKVLEIAAPMGVVFGIIPLTNPVPTIVFKTLICLKSRNSLIYSCHRNVLGTGNQAGMLIRKILEKHKAPPDLVLWVKERTSRKTTSMFMTHPGVSLILATGGPGMVKAAYSSGTPAIGVGSGNAPVWVCPDADIDATAKIIIDSKSFDNGVICGSENNIIVDRSIRKEFINALARHGARVLSKEEVKKASEQFIDPQTKYLKRTLVGQNAGKILDSAGIPHEKGTKLVVVPVEQSMVKTAWGGEMLAPVISLFTAENEFNGIQFCLKLLEKMGAGHTAIIHTTNMDLVRKFGNIMPVSRILHNCPGSTGCIGFGNGLRPSFTLGCGSWGNTSTTDNVGYNNLINIKRIASAL